MTVKRYTWHPVKVIVIWVTALAISAVPIGLLARRHPRAVLAGALVVALLVVYALGGFGLGGAGAGAGASSGLAGLVIMWIAVMVALVILLLITVARMSGSLEERLKWTAAGVGVWILVGMIVSRASGEVQDLRRQAELQAFLDRAAQAEAEIPRTRRELDKAPERRRVILDSTLAQVKGEVVLSYRPVDRFVVLGDPATEPEHVVVWAVITPTPKQSWPVYSFYGERLHQRLNSLLRERGYPAKIALGFASAAAIDSAGGDQAYFGRDGSELIPQYQPDNVIGSHPRRLEAPRRRG